jgi:hypothetical protein
VRQAAILVGLTSRSLLEFAIGIDRGFIRVKRRSMGLYEWMPVIKRIATNTKAVATTEKYTTFGGNRSLNWPGSQMLPADVFYCEHRPQLRGERRYYISF